jgi:hypothetical protein
MSIYGLSFRVMSISWPRRSFALAAAPLALIALGCGGGGGGGGNGGGGGGGAATAQVTSSPTSITYGQSSNVTWSASNNATFVSSDFGLTANNFQNGTIADTPGTTTTYTLTVGTPQVTDTSTVTVAPVAADVLVVGDVLVQNTTTAQAVADALTTGTVNIAAAVPDPDAFYEVLVISPTIAFTADGRTQVKKWLDADKGVVLLGRSPRVLATGDVNNSDVSALGAWFFGVNTLGAALGADADVRTSATGLVRLSVAIRGDSAPATDGEGSITGAAALADNVVAGEILAYEVPTNGRLVYSASPVGNGTVAGGAYRQAFESAFRWVAQ